MLLTEMGNEEMTQMLSYKKVIIKHVVVGRHGLGLVLSTLPPVLHGPPNPGVSLLGGLF